MVDELPPQPGPEAPWTGLIKTRKIDGKRKEVMESVPFVPGLTLLKDFKFTKRDPALAHADRKEFNRTHRKEWLQGLGKDEKSLEALRTAGMSEAQIALVKNGEVPPGYEVHHKLALDDGGTNTPSNYVLIQTDPYHTAITALHCSQCRDIPVGTTQTLDWPVPDGIVYPPTKPAS